MTCSATAGRQDSLTVPTVELVCITVCTQKMLVSDVNVSFHSSVQLDTASAMSLDSVARNIFTSKPFLPWAWKVNHS